MAMIHISEYFCAHFSDNTSTSAKHQVKVNVIQVYAHTYNRRDDKADSFYPDLWQIAK